MVGPLPWIEIFMKTSKALILVASFPLYGILHDNKQSKFWLLSGVIHEHFAQW